MGERERERRKKKETQAVALHLGANGVFHEWTTFQKFVAVRHCLAGRRLRPSGTARARKRQRECRGEGNGGISLPRL